MSQKIIKIVKPEYKGKLLQVGKEEWQSAYKIVKPSAFAIYLYLASNPSEAGLELSAATIEDALGIKKTAYFDAIKQLEKESYILPIGNNEFVFQTAKSAKTEWAKY